MSLLIILNNIFKGKDALTFWKWIWSDGTLWFFFTADYSCCLWEKGPV